MKSYEVNFEGFPGPTHNYAGLSFGNVASMNHAAQHSNPKEAALQSLQKIRLIHSLGIKQAILPPQERPNIQLLRSLGFFGSDHEVLKFAFKEAPDLFKTCYSSSSMWAANAATVSPSVDSSDGKLHITISNLTSNLHRAQEALFTAKVFKSIFSDRQFFSVHLPLLSANSLRDEGAANHNRFCLEYGLPGVEMFVFGESGLLSSRMQHLNPTQYPARQTKEAQEAIARLHHLPPSKTLFARQNPKAIDAGVFHNDVISVANKNVFIYHEQAFEDTAATLKQIQQTLDFPSFLIAVNSADLSLEEAVQSYLFNSQLLSLDSEKMILIAPEESRTLPRAQQVLQSILSQDNPITRIEYVDCRQSMQNGGGPACLRLRVVMTETELQHCHTGVLITNTLLTQLESWVSKHYRDRLSAEDLLDNALEQESRQALDELTTLLDLGSLYPFQQG